MTLRKALQQSKWRYFRNDRHPNEFWEVANLLKRVPPGKNPQWLDAECAIVRGNLFSQTDIIIDAYHDLLFEIKEGRV